MSVKEFLAELFDANFDRLLTPPTAKVIYVICLAVTTAISGAVALTGIGLGVIYEEPAFRLLTPILALTVAAGMFLVGALMSRLFAEAWIVVYRIGLNTGRLVDLAAGDAAVEDEMTGLSDAEDRRLRRSVA